MGKKVIIKGSVHKINSLGGIEFFALRDRSGMTQIVFEGSVVTQKICCEAIIEVEGLITKEERSPYDNIEIKGQSLKILGSAASDLPIAINGNYNNINLPTLLDYRGLSVRIPKVSKVFKIQSEILRLYGEYLRKNDFSEIKTSKIISTGTEGGANIFELKYFDRVAYLAQSPQFYKQTMVGSGFERVFEVGPVFRAEMSNTVRHLSEYTSMDLEMGFIKDEQDIIDMQENLLKYMFTEIKKLYGDEIKEEFGVDIVIPEVFPRIHFLEALDIAYKKGVKDMDGDISPEGEKAVCDYADKELGSPFVYIVGYPIKKRPMYTMPDERLPGYTRSFDLLYKGLEITTGGQRINDYETLRKNIIAFGGNPNSFKTYLDIFKYGMPPHGGLGMGLERVTMKMLGFNNVREASLFPRDIGRITP
ncbi:MAG: aspartate--tRNA(Asn) ligase [Spirochaetes bacterium GWD1_27_9]|nr:MAG: aspartate--tRNA(Asn) ligase [Spirochaetes bacterium GWD1_27_9]